MEFCPDLTKEFIQDLLEKLEEEKKISSNRNDLFESKIDLINYVKPLWSEAYNTLGGLYVEEQGVISALGHARGRINTISSLIDLISSNEINILYNLIYFLIEEYNIQDK